MNNLLNLVHKKVLVLVTVLILMIATLVIISLNKGGKTFIPNSIVTQTPTPAFSITPLQRVVVNQTTPQEVENSYPAENKTVLSDGSVKYTFISPLKSRPAEVIFKDNVAIFERTIIISNPTTTGLSTITEFRNQFGSAEKIIKGSSFWGRDMLTYIYPSKGFAFIANGFNDQVLELHTFKPTTIDGYIKSYGEDIIETTTPTVDF
jgi:hypothetical protein